MATRCPEVTLDADRSGPKHTSSPTQANRVADDIAPDGSSSEELVNEVVRGSIPRGGSTLPLCFRGLWGLVVIMVGFVGAIPVPFSLPVAVRVTEVVEALGLTAPVPHRCRRSSTASRSSRWLGGCPQDHGAHDRGCPRLWPRLPGHRAVDAGREPPCSTRGPSRGRQAAHGPKPTSPSALA
jgi:hypothetical protein